jgi:hypothetical protein
VWLVAAWLLLLLLLLLLLPLPTAVLGLFTLPKVYEMRKDEIDDAFLKTHNAAQQHYMNAKVKVG